MFTNASPFSALPWVLTRQITAAATLACALTVGSLTAAATSTLEAPAEAVVLTVSGAIAVTNGSTTDGPAAQFDMAMLGALDPVTFTTTTIWTDGPQEFTGVPLERLLATVGAAGGTIRATALNDYSVEIPAGDAVEGGPIVAFAQNGKPMSLRDKGPLWIVYPYDSKKDYQSEVIYSRSIWQLDRIAVNP